MDSYGFSDVECKIIKSQVERRCKYREEFLKMRTDPCKHAMEAGYVFDPAVQRFMSLKSCHYETFKPTIQNAMFGIFTAIVPMVIYGSLIYIQRRENEKACRSGQLKYRDRLFKHV